MQASRNLAASEAETLNFEKQGRIISLLERKSSLENELTRLNSYDDTQIASKRRYIGIKRYNKPARISAGVHPVCRRVVGFVWLRNWFRTVNAEAEREQTNTVFE